MKNFMASLLMVMVLALVSCGSSERQAAPAPAAPQAAAASPSPTGKLYKVTIEGFAYHPETITIKKGDSITWTNEDAAPHTSTGKGFDSGLLKTTESWTYTFSETGTFDYVCSIHLYMKAHVVVE